MYCGSGKQYFLVFKCESSLGWSDVAISLVRLANQDQVKPGHVALCHLLLSILDMTQFVFSCLYVRAEIN